MFNPFDSTSTEDAAFSFEAPVEETGNMFNAPVTPPPAAPMQQSTPQSSGKKGVYNIVDLYWLVNSKLYNHQKLNEDELELAILGYNADFNNLRISLNRASPATFTESSILKYEAKQVMSINVFSETAQQLLFALNQKQVTKVSNFERVFSANMSNEWKPAVSAFEVDGTNKIVTLQVTGSNGRGSSFTFSGWEIFALGNALNFMTNGQAWRASLQLIASKNS